MSPFRGGNDPDLGPRALGVDAGLMGPVEESRAFRDLRRSILEDPILGQATVESFSRLGSVRGKTVVEMGCGEGEVSVFFALHGARVVGFDVRADALEHARRLAHDFGVQDRCAFVRCRSERIAIGAARAGLVFSRSTLQYMDRVRALAEAVRVLEPGGSLVLIENLKHNPFVNLYRLMRLVRPNGAPRAGFRNLGYLSFAEIEGLRRTFPDLEHRELDLFRPIPLALLRGFGGHGWIASLNAGIARLDRGILDAIPAARRLGWFAVITGHKG